MKKINLIISMLILLMPIALAQEEVKNSVNPNGILWGLDVALEKLQIRLTNGETAKSNLRLEFVEERLQEVKEMIDSNKLRHADLALNEFDKQVKILTNLTLSNNMEKNVLMGLQKSLLRLEEIRQDAPVTARKGLETAIDAHRANIGRLDKRMSLTSKGEDVVSGY